MKNIVIQITELGIDRIEIFGLTESDYVRISKQIKLKFKKTDEENLNALSNILDALRDDLANLKTVFKEDMIYFTLRGKFKEAENARYFYFKEEKNHALKQFFLKHFRQDLIEEFSALIAQDNYKDLEHWMKIANIYPDELKEDVNQLLMSKIDISLEEFRKSEHSYLGGDGNKWLKSKEFYGVLSIKESQQIKEKLDELVEQICLQFYKKDEIDYYDYEIDLLKFIKGCTNLSSESKSKIESAFANYLLQALSDTVSNKNHYRTFLLGLGVVIFIFMFTGILILMSQTNKSRNEYSAYNKDSLKDSYAHRKSNDRPLFEKHINYLYEITGSDCNKAYDKCHANLIPYTSKFKFDYKVEKLNLKTGEDASMGLEDELPLVATGMDITFANKTSQSVLIFIVRPNYKFNHKDYSIFFRSGGKKGCGRYFVGPGKSLKFDSRILYFKIQTGASLKQIKINSNRIDKSNTGYAFCPFNERDAKLFKMDINVKNSTAAIGGEVVLTMSGSNYKLNWNGKDSALSINKDIYLKKNSTFTLGK